MACGSKYLRVCGLVPDLLLLGAHQESATLIPFSLLLRGMSVLSQGVGINVIPTHIPNELHMTSRCNLA